VTRPDDDATAPVDLPFPGASSDPAAPATADPPGPPPPPAAGTAAAVPPRAPVGPPLAADGPVPSSTGPTHAAPPRSPALGADAMPGLAFGVLLVAIGGTLLLTRLIDIGIDGDAWPLWIIVPGVAMLVASFAIPARGGLGLAIAGSIVATVGLIVWVQATYDAYATWAYAWALVAPAAAGVGTLLYGAVKGDGELVRNGLRMTLVGLALFAGFALFFEGILGLSGEPVAGFDELMPFVVIGLGALFVVLSVVGGGRRSRTAR
jgi:hypothetical protein